jgi:ribosome-associated protein
MEPIDFPLRGAHIHLDALLKASGLASSGGAAKTLIAEGGVRVNGEPELRRGRKLRDGRRGDGQCPARAHRPRIRLTTGFRSGDPARPPFKLAMWLMRRRTEILASVGEKRSVLMGPAPDGAA